MASVGQSRTPRDLSSLGASIADIVQNRVAGGGRDVTSPVSGGLSGLGDRIRAAVEGARGEASPVTPGAGGPALGPATTSIMDSVRNQLARSTVAQQAGPAPSAPNIGTMPTTPGGAAPLTQTAGYAAPGTNQAMGYATPGQPVGDPQGIVQAPLQMGNAQGMDWSSVNQWDAEIAAAVAKYPEVDPAMIKAAMAMESLGNPQAKNPASSSFGVLQIQPEWHRESARQMGLTLSADGGTPADDIMYWTALMAGKAPGQQVQGATPLDRYINNYQQPPGYRADVESLMAEINGAAPPPQQAPPQGEAAGIPPGSVGGLLGQSGGITPGPQVTPPPPQNTAPPPQNPNYPVGGMLGGVIPIPPGGQNPGSGVIAPNGGFTLPPAGAVIQVSGDPNAQQIVDIARLYVDIVPYESLDVWNGNPGAGVDPRDPAQHGWDCSGMVYWMDQNYGTGQIPEGSHEQYNFFDQTDPNFHSRDAAVTAGDYSSLNVGDIVYMDTDGTVRGGNEASHVAVYIGNGQFINAANPSEGTTIWDGLNGYRVLGVATYWPQGGSAAPTSSGYTAQPASSYSTQPAPSPGLGGGGYITGGQYVAPAPQQALPPPSAYQSSGGAPATTGQVTTDSSGRQYETMADGTQRLIYDPSW